MAGGKSVPWRWAAAWLRVGGPAGAGGAAPGRPARGGGRDHGPTRWLMGPEEHRKFRRLHTTREAVDFIEAFWRRRDPDPNSPGNEFSKTFYERVEAADSLYSEGGTRGSLTDRGRALILLGPPPVQRYFQKKVPGWDPGRPGAPSAVQTRILSLESWAYAVADLPPALQQRIQEDDGRAEIVLAFAVDPRHTYLIEGDKYLDMAARAALRE